MISQYRPRADNRWLMFTSVSKFNFRCTSHTGPIEPHKQYEVDDTVPVGEIA